VILECVISPAGDVESARVLRSVPLLDQAAIDAVKQWQYTPTMLNGVAVPVIMTVTVNFSLQAEGARAGAPGLGAAAGPLLSDDEAQREPFLLAQGRVGVLQVGMSVDTLNRRIPAAQRTLVDLRDNDHFTPAIDIRLEPGQGPPAIRARYRNVDGQWTIWLLEVQNPRFRTADGLGVGSTLADIHAAVPEARATVGPRGGVPVVILRDRGLVLRLDPTGVTGQTVPETAVVTQVTVAAFPSGPQPPPTPDRP
jgi:TonB family protein